LNLFPLPKGTLKILIVVITMYQQQQVCMQQQLFQPTRACDEGLGLRWFTSKQPKLGLMQELSCLELVSPLEVTHLPPVLLPLA